MLMIVAYIAGRNEEGGYRIRCCVEEVYKGMSLVALMISGVLWVGFTRMYLNTNVKYLKSTISQTCSVRVRSYPDRYGLTARV